MSRFDRIYRPLETVTGILLLTAKDGWSHTGVTLNATGTATLQLPSSSNEIKPRILMNESIKVLESGRLDMGVTKVPFSFTVKGQKENALLETYHGAYISVNYVVKVTVERGVMKRGLEKELEFIVEVPQRKKDVSTAIPTEFHLTPSTLDKVNSSVVGRVPGFDIQGVLHRKNCLINLPIMGEVVINSSENVIECIDLQLVRVESVSKALGGSSSDVSKGGEMAKEATEIESLQIAIGDDVRGLTIPIYMVLPRVYTCPSLKTATFQVEFELNLQVVFEDGYMVTENFPISLHRTQ
ncbi:hypothetical protein TL16_g11664 [Triparma laevis f. inornata]|uniref:Down syndrome critical region protein 3 n=1 Tax=Triparma laevis f. inornata TaxID=1714386 RepID=A0A9W7BM21_9STRA|nr:hypothetical protein TL16_g11664 [Triparma laevis f. inornata]